MKRPYVSSRALPQRGTPADGPTRRHFLRGTGGLLLSLPFLESFLTKAEAQAKRQVKRFVSIQSDHGGAWAADLHPTARPLASSQNYAGHEVWRSSLALSTNSGQAELSPILRAPSSVLTSGLAAKMNVLRGLGVPFFGFHHAGGHLGNWATIQSNPHKLEDRPTIDTIMAYAPGFYDQPPLVRVMLCGADTPMIAAASWGYENPRRQEGPVVPSAPAGSSRRLFDRIYAPPSASSPPNRSLVDRVLADYHRLRSDRRLSERDRMRLDAHITHLNELEGKLSRVTATCPSTQPPLDNSDPRFAHHDSQPEQARESLQLWCDVVALAFACDTSRIAVIPIASTFSDWDGTGARDFHQAIAHQAGVAHDPSTPPVDPPHPRFRMAERYQRVFEHGFLYLAQKLDALDDGEGTLLDSTLIAWSHEAGPQTHEAMDMPVITAGSAGGAMRTGMHMDYRNQSASVQSANPAWPELIFPGLHWHQYLGTILQIMGVAPTLYTTDEYGGYGDEFVSVGSRASGQYPESTYRVRGELLPFLT